MSIISLQSLEKSFGGQLILNPLSLEINRSQHIGFVGRNGVGKTTLLKMLSRLEEPSSGHIRFHGEVKVGYLAQDPNYPPGRTLYEEVREGIASLDAIEEELRKIESRLAEIGDPGDSEEHTTLLERYGELHDHFEANDGWSADSRVETILDGLKIPRNDWERDISTFSGGERNVIGLAKMLVTDPDVMFLDEPGNHLDFEGLEWLEMILRASKHAFLLVSHNRYLLDAVCDTIWEFERGTITPFTGNYTAYRAEKSLLMAKAESAARSAKKERERLLFQVQRLKSWASVYDNPKLAKTAKRLEKRAEELGETVKLREDTRSLGLAFGRHRTRGDIALDVQDYTLRFEGHEPLIKEATFRIKQGEKVALVGANGTGKTTLFQAIVREGRWEHPVLRVGKSMKIGYFSQLGETLERRNILIEEAQRLSGLLRNEAEKILYRFLFTRDDFQKSVQVLSGGEKARLQLACIMASQPNFMLLDEPTNHLDIISREAVEDALDEFQGTLFVISHDRYFLDKMVDRVLHLSPPRIIQYEGNFSDFWAKRKELIEADLSRKKRKIAAKKNENNQENRFRRIKFDARRFEFLESEILRLEEQKERLIEEIERETAKGNQKRSSQKESILQRTESTLDEIYSEWFAMGDKKKSY